MKKLLIGLALVSFVAFGTLGIQSVIADDNNTEIVNLQLDDDPKKDKKSDAKVDGKTKQCAKSCDKSKTKCCPDAKAKCETDAKKCETKCKEKKSPAGGDKK